jgi:hypothetical protein
MLAGYPTTVVQEKEPGTTQPNAVYFSWPNKGVQATPYSVRS